MSSNDNKILVQLAHPYNYEFRPFKKDVFWCQDEETRKKIIEVELKHFEKFYYLSIANESYKSIADADKIDEAITRYYQNTENMDVDDEDMDINNEDNKNDSQYNNNQQTTLDADDDLKIDITDDTMLNESKEQITMKNEDEIIAKRQIFLERIDTIFGIIFDVYYLSSSNKTRYTDNALLKKIDSLVIKLQIFSLICYTFKKNDKDTLKLGKYQCQQKLKDMNNVNRKKYKPFIDIMYYALDGNKITFPKRKQTKGELNANVNAQTNSVNNDEALFQNRIDITAKKFIKNKKHLQKKYNDNLENANDLPRINRVDLPEMDQLYKVFGMKKQELVTFVSFSIVY